MAEKIQEYLLRGDNCDAIFLNLGCILKDWRISHYGANRHVVLGYENAADYQDNPHYLGTLNGPIANRVANARFDYDGVSHQLDANDGPHHLHGGTNSLATRDFTVTRQDSGSIRFQSDWLAGEGGYPGAARIGVGITLSDQSLIWEIEAETDRPTPLSLAIHPYFNLSAQGGIETHDLQIHANAYTPTSPELVPTGEIAKVADTGLDFRRSRALGKDEELDVNFVLDPDATSAATLRGDDGLMLDISTDQRGLQVYSGAALSRLHPPLPGQSHMPFSGIALEPQGLPNAVNIPDFPSVIVTPDTPYRQVTRMTLSAEI